MGVADAVESRFATLAAGSRALFLLTAFLLFTLPLMPVQAFLVRTAPRRAGAFAHWYHKQVCRLLGVHLRIEGSLARDRAVLLIANHTSWLDIPVISAVAPVSFVAKLEVANWPFVSSLARLQRTIFVDRTRRKSVGATASEMIARLNAGDTLVLFAEGTSSDGNRVLPFKSSLFAAAKPPSGRMATAPGTVVQTLAIVYTHLHGVPLGRADRPFVGWYGDMVMGSHAWELLKSGPLDVSVRLGPPVPLESFADRKQLARQSEAELRQSVVDLLRGPPFAPHSPPARLVPATETTPQMPAASSTL